MPLADSDAKRILEQLENLPLNQAYGPKKIRDLATPKSEPWKEPKALPSPPLAPQRDDALLTLIASDIRNLSPEEMFILQQELETLLKTRKVIPVKRMTELIVIWSMQRMNGRFLSDAIEPPKSEEEKSSTSSSGE